MNGKSPKTILLGLGLLLTILLVIGGYVLNSPGRRGPRPLPVLGQLPPFTLTNQMGHAVSSSAMRGRVWIADAIFTRCPGPCPILTAHLAQVQKAFSANQPVSLVSLTVDPGYDQPPVLARYAQRFGADSKRWWFLTGTKHQLYEVIVKGLKLVATATEPASRPTDLDMSLHSTRLVLIDRTGRIRGYYDGLGTNAVATVLRAIHTLLDSGPA